MQSVSIKVINRSIIKHEVESELRVSVRWKIGKVFFLLPKDPLANLLTTFIQFMAFNRHCFLKWRVYLRQLENSGLTHEKGEMQITLCLTKR